MSSAACPPHGRVGAVTQTDLKESTTTRWGLTFFYPVFRGTTLLAVGAEPHAEPRFSGPSGNGIPGHRAIAGEYEGHQQDAVTGDLERRQ